MEEANRVKFHFLVSNFSLQNRSQLKLFITELFKKEGLTVAHINYIFCSDKYLLQLNKNYLKHNTYTDIITFPFSSEREAVLSDIYISVDRVKENAADFYQSFKEELHRVILHGALHLCGYKDKTLGDKKIMREKEAYYLRQYFVSRET